MQLVDFHSHLFSRAFFEALAAASPLPGAPSERLERVTRAAGIELPPQDVEEHVGRWIGELERHGVAHLVSFASVPEEAESLLVAVRAAAGRVTGMAVVDPTREGAPERIASLLDAGLRGAVLFPAMHRYRVDGPEATEVLAVLDERRAIAIVHCGLLRVSLRDSFRLPRAYDLRLAHPLAVAAAADRHPRVTFVIPHFGAGYLRETLLAGEQSRNVCVDTSSSNAWLRTQPHPLTLADVFERALDVFGSDRILFGTDSSTFPRGWRRDLLLAQKEALGACGATDRDQERILGGNALRLLQ